MPDWDPAFLELMLSECRIHSPGRTPQRGLGRLSASLRLRFRLEPARRCSSALKAVVARLPSIVANTEQSTQLRHRAYEVTYPTARPVVLINGPWPAPFGSRT